MTNVDRDDDDNDGVDCDGDDGVHRDDGEGVDGGDDDDNGQNGCVLPMAGISVQVILYIPSMLAKNSEKKDNDDFGEKIMMQGMMGMNNMQHNGMGDGMNGMNNGMQVILIIIIITIIIIIIIIIRTKHMIII